MTNDRPRKTRSRTRTWAERRSDFLGGVSSDDVKNGESDANLRDGTSNGALSADLSPEAARGEAPLESKRPRRKARDKVMDLLARRAYSALELRNKLSPYYEAAEIEAAIQFAEDNKWMLPPAEMASRVSLELGRRKKGHRYITQFLKKKGLPQVEKDIDSEVEKALLVIEDKAERLGRRSIGHLQGDDDPDLELDAPIEAAPKDYQAKRAEYVERNKRLQKLQSTLASRGFDGDTISRAMRIWKERQL